MKTKIAAFSLCLVAFFWGLTFPLIENSMQTEDPILFVALRFSIAGLILTPFLFKQINKQLIFAGMFLGFLNCGANLTQTIGLQTINASRAAFITGTNVIFIPFIVHLFKIKSLRIQDLISALVCVLGIYILTGSDTSALTKGDAWVFLCSFFVAITIIYIEYVSKNNLDPYTLTCTQIVATAFFSWILYFIFSENTYSIELFQNHTFIAAILYCSLFATIISLGLQTKFQKYISAQKAALILCLEPIFATFFDFVINGTAFTTNVIIGGLLILASIAILELKYPIPVKGNN